jgi:uncharacterized protein YecT (DUF1311 family)
MSDDELKKLREEFQYGSSAFALEMVQVIDEALARGAEVTKLNERWTGRGMDDVCPKCSHVMLQFAAKGLNSVDCEVCAARAERDEARAALVKAQKDAALTEAWLVERIDEELRREGLPALSWTDGGGSACPTGWHRNPYLNSGRVAVLEAALAKAEQERDSARESQALAEGLLRQACATARGLALEEFRRIVNPIYKLNDAGDLGKKQRERLNNAIDQLTTLPPSLVAVDVGVLERAIAFIEDDTCRHHHEKRAALAELRAQVKR